MKLCNYFKTSPYISLVNMLAGQELFPEFLTTHCAAHAMGTQVLQWLSDADAYAAIRADLASLCQRVAEPGACARVARFILDKLSLRKCA
jgi:lipid-A-disaccharide synthase